MFLFPFWSRNPTRKTNCRMSLVSCQSGTDFSVILSSMPLTAQPFYSARWLSTCMSQLGLGACCAPFSVPGQEGQMTSRPSSGDVKYIRLVKPISARFLHGSCHSTNWYLVGKILRLPQYLVLCLTFAYWWHPRAWLANGDSIRH